MNSVSFLGIDCTKDTIKYIKYFEVSLTFKSFFIDYRSVSGKMNHILKERTGE